ncbi:MAG: hypothetical protein KC713_03365 [Candidatus Omnitrophica bacterium]|nr:hypothetical protein [Candidatus Omnitrophota bacterium]
MQFTFLTYIPFLISICFGTLLVNTLFINKKSDRIINFLLGGGIGLGVSSHATFLSYVLFNQLNVNFVIGLNIAMLIITSIVYVTACRRQHQPIIRFSFADLKHLWPFLIITLFSLPFWYEGHFYLNGGWDAWSVWNLKAKFLFLGTENWKAIFNPLMWRSSPHYPLLLPMINVYGWSFLGEPNPLIPCTTAALLTFLLTGLLTFSLIRLTKSYYAVICAPVLLTLPYFVKLCLSQYADVAVGYYLLASVVCLIFAQKENNKVYALLSGIMVGLLSFTKSEALVAALLLTLLGGLFLIWKQPWKDVKWTVICFLGACVIGLLPAAAFKIFFSPGNQTFINGLLSAEKPADLMRVKIIFSFYLMELISPNWNGLWIVLSALLIFAVKRIFSRELLIIPAFIFCYAGIITAYYFINTYFVVDWWLMVSFHRIIYAIIPTVILWTFYAVFKKKQL